MRGKATIDSAYIDPQLVVLLFLFGFSLLYAVVLIFDIAIKNGAPDRVPDE